MFVVAVLVTVRTHNCIFGSNGCVGRALVQQCAVYVMGGVSSHWLLCVLLARLAIGYCASFLHSLAIGYCASFLHCLTIGYCVLLASWHWLLRDQASQLCLGPSFLALKKKKKTKTLSFLTSLNHTRHTPDPLNRTEQDSTR